MEFHLGNESRNHFGVFRGTARNFVGVVFNSRKNTLLKHKSKNDRIDARKLADQLCLNDLEPVYHGETGVRMLRELARSYLTIVKDLSRVMNPESFLSQLGRWG